MKKNDRTKELKTLKGFIDKYTTQRNMAETALITFYDTRTAENLKNVDDFVLGDMIDELEYFNKKIIKAIKMYNELNDAEKIRRELAHFGVNL